MNDGLWQVLSKITTDVVVTGGGCADRRAELSACIFFFSLRLHYLLGHFRLDTQNPRKSLADAVRKLPAFTPYPKKTYPLKALLLVKPPLSWAHCN